MIGDFRMMPRQAPWPDEPHLRHGFFINGHPKGDPTQGGLYFASWQSYEVACAAAICLGLDWHLVQDSTYLPASSIRRE